MLRLALAAAHLLALGIGLGSVWVRARALRGAAQDAGTRAALGPSGPSPDSPSPDGLTPGSLRPAFVADNWWGVAAGLWLATGLWRAIGGTEKTPSYYAQNVVFWAKMGLFATLLLLEAWPMVTLIRWRIAVGRGVLPPGGPRTAARLARVSEVEVVLVVLIVLAAVAMARGYGARG